jgi:hypothetical protein
MSQLRTNQTRGPWGELPAGSTPRSGRQPRAALPARFRRGRFGQPVARPSGRGATECGVQFSLFGAEAADPIVDDLDGLLFAGGDWVRTEKNSAARLSVLVSDDWRAAALTAELAARSLSSDTVPAPGGLIAVRTEITGELTAHAARWTRGASLRLPADLELTASGLRLWSIATGRTDEHGYLLGVAEPDGAVHRAGGAQLAKLGVAAVAVGVRGGPGWRVTSAKRLRRLAELVGEAPTDAGADWPSSP